MFTMYFVWKTERKKLVYYKQELHYTKISLVTTDVRLTVIVTCISNISTTKRMCVMKTIRKKLYFRIAVNGLGILTLTFSFWGTGFLAEKQSLRGYRMSLQT